MKNPLPFDLQNIVKKDKEIRPQMLIKLSYVESYLGEEIVADFYKLNTVFINFQEYTKIYNDYYEQTGLL